MTEPAWTMPDIDRTVAFWSSPWGWTVTEPKNFILGENTDIGRGTDIFCHEKVVIGKHVKIGGHCLIYTMSAIGRSEHRAPIIIEDYAQIGAMSLILPGVIVGEGARVAPFSKVSCDIPPHQLWGSSRSAIFWGKLP